MTGGAPAPDSSAVSLGHLPALDGLRGVAIVLVLAFHGGWEWMHGGYVGVSVFFTLSGFLITSLLLDEHSRTGRVDLAAFVGRRIRRLLPASLLCLAAVSLLARAGILAVTDRLRGDIVAAALQVANWRALSGSESYADLVAAVGGVVGPVDHFWSLSVEEQFYWLWPACFLLLVSVCRSRAAFTASLAVLTVVAGVAAVAIARLAGPEAAYWATPARLGELLAGVTLAAALRRRSVPPWLGRSGWVGLGVVLWAAVTWPTSSGPAYEGWLPLFALASAALVAGAVGNAGLRRALSWRPLVLLGLVSYGVYLYHWPLFAVLSERRTGLDGPLLFGVRVTATLAVSACSYLFVERPAREWVAPLRVAAPGAVLGSIAVAALAIAVVPAPDAPVRELDTSAVGFHRTDSTPPVPATDTRPAATTPAATTPAATTEPTVDPAPVRAGPIDLLLLGDSTALGLGAGLLDWAGREPTEVRLESAARLGCGMIPEAVMIVDVSRVYQTACREAMGPYLDGILATGAPDVAIILVTLPDGVSRVWSESEGALPATDSRYRERRLAAYESVIDRLLRAGTRRVVLLIPAVPSSLWSGYEGAVEWDTDFDGLRAMITGLGRSGDSVVVADFGAWLEAQESDPLTGGPSAWRSDGLHLDQEAAVRVVEQFVAPLLLEIAGPGD